MASSPSSTEPTASTVVFSLAHLRDSIFAFHASAIKQRRQDVLGRIPRPIALPLWGDVSYHCFNHRVQNFFEMDLRRVQTTTSILQLMRKLGLKPAAWVDYCLDRPRDLNAWLTTYSNCDAELAKAFQPHPHSVHRSGGRHDEPLANPMEMLMYSVVRQHYVVGEHPPQSALVSQQYLMCDEDGSTFVLRIVDRDVEPFFHQAVEKCPDLLFSETSPFFPLHDFVSYTNDDRFGLIVSSTPPAPFSRHLDFINIHAGDELRRILERGRDVYWHLAQLEKYGISMDGQTPMDGWQLSLVFAHWGPWLLPSYLRPSSQRGRGDRFTRTCHVAEELPEPPASAWPLPFYSCKGAVVRSIPWSQSAAFHDPRVRGPTTYLHGVDIVSWQDEGASERREKNLKGALRKETDLHLNIEPSNRFHSDLIMMSQVVLDHFTRYFGLDHDDIVQVLESSVPSDAYLATLDTPVEKLPRASDHPISSLFTFCSVCITWGRSAYQAAHEDRSEPFDGKCPTCKEPYYISAIPEPLRLLLLRIVKPVLDDAGEPILVKAQEAFEVFDSFLKTDMARIEAKYKEWAAHQNKVVRPERPKDLSLATIMEQEGYHRLLLFEHLRGRFLDDEPLLPETRLYTMKYFIRDQLTPTQKRKVEELRAICGSLNSAPQAGATSSSGKRAAESDGEKEAESEKKIKVAEEQEVKAEEAAEEASEDMNVDHADE